MGPVAPCESRLSEKAAALLKPVLSEWLVAHSEKFDADGKYLRESPHEKVFDKRFGKLLATTGAAADEAIAALLAFYVGEANSEDLVCDAIRRGRRIRPYLQRFLRCTPVTGLEPIPSFYTDIPNLREEALQRIDAGKPCEY